MEQPKPKDRRIVGILIGVFVASVLTEVVRGCNDEMERRAAFDAAFRQLQEASRSHPFADMAASAPTAATSSAAADALHDEIQAALRKAREARGEKD